MRASTILFCLAAAGSTLAQAECTAPGLTTCLQQPAVTNAPCATAGCACSQLQVKAACYKSFCPSTLIDPQIFTAYSSVCAGFVAGGTTVGAAVTAAATATAVAKGGAVGNGGAATAASPASTSTGGANSAVIPAGGFLLAALGFVSYL